MLEESLSITSLSHFGYLMSFRRYSRSKSKVVKNRAEFWTFFSSSQILGGRSSKSYTHVMRPVSRHVVWKMFCGDTPISPEVIVANTLNFKPNLKFSRLNFFGGTPSQLGCALGSIGQSVARVKISGRSTPWGPRCSLLRKIHLGGSMLANKTFLWTKVHRTFYMERGRNRCLSHFFQILDIWSRSGDIRDQSRKLSKIALNFGRFFRPHKF